MNVITLHVLLDFDLDTYSHMVNTRRKGYTYQLKIPYVTFTVST